MNKKIVFFLVFSIAILYLNGVDKTIKNSFSTLNMALSAVYLRSVEIVQDRFNRYFKQLDYIKTLKEKNDELEQYKILYTIEHNKLLENRSIVFDNNILKNKNFSKVKFLSYYSFDTDSKVIVEIEKDNNKTIKALISYDGYSTGIVVKKENRFIAFLNNDPKCNYAVYIGEAKGSGITTGMTKDGKLIVDYIPLWKEIKVDDEVITSGMDGIFPYGIKVGKVVSISKNDITQKVLIKPYGKIVGSRYYFIY